MPRLRKIKSTPRETAVSVQGRPLVVTLWPAHFEIRQKGRRWGYQVSYESIFRLGASQTAIQKRIEKKGGVK